MGKISLFGSGILLALLFTVLFLTGLCSSEGLGDTKNYDWMGTPVIVGGQGKTTFPDWLSPSSAGRPDWDPYGPGSIYYPALGRAAWDPYAPIYSRNILKIEASDPAAEGLTIQGNLRTPNQLYLQRDGFLVTDGRVALGEPYVLWAAVGNFGNFVLYDNGEAALSQSYLRPGWYRITGFYPEILSSHLYRFASAGLTSNELTVAVDAGGYPTSFGLTGRVVDISGIGMQGVKVVIAGSDGGIFTTTTNAQGYYGFDAPSGSYTITAEQPGYSFTPSTARVWTGTVSVAQTITGYPAGTYTPASQTAVAQASQSYGSGLNAGYTGGYAGAGMGWVQGKIAEQSGTPIPLARIRADGLMTTASSDSQGNYKVALNPGMHRIDAERSGYAIPPRAAMVISGQTATLDLTGRRTATLGAVI